jgi:hypothetical protein
MIGARSSSIRRFNFLRSFRKNCHLIRGFNNHLAAAHELNRAVARGQVQFECRLIPKEVPDSAVVHREQQVHFVIVLHVVADDDYWPLPHCRILSSRVVPVPVYQFPCVLLSSVTVSLPALNLADQPEARYSRRYRTLLAPVLPRPNRGHTPSAAVRGNLGRN